MKWRTMNKTDLACSTLLMLCAVAYGLAGLVICVVDFGVIRDQKFSREDHKS